MIISQKLTRSAIIVLLFLSFASCGIKKSIWLRDIEAVKGTSETKEIIYEHIIVPDDKITLNVWGHPELSNLIVFGSSGNLFSQTSSAPTPATTMVGSEDQGLLVNKEGMVNLPLLGETKVGDLTMSQAADFIKAQYSKYYGDLVVKVNVINRTVTILGEVIHPGPITLKKEQTNIFEVIASAGDFTPDANRSTVKIIRGKLGDPTVIDIDLSSKNCFKYPKSLIIHADDVVYVEPLRRKLAAAALANIIPYLSAVAALLSAIDIIVLLRR